MSCFDANGRAKWGIFALLAIIGVALTSLSGPAFFSTLAGKSGPDSFRGCSHCVQDFGLEVLKTVNATDIVDKLEKIHERNERNHFHHHHHHHDHHHPHHRHAGAPDGGSPDFDFDEDECITSKDLEDLKPDLKSLVIPDWKDECKDICTPVLKAVPLAATTSGVLLFVGLISGICSLIPLCLLCCGCCKDERPAVPPQWQPTYRAVPGATPVGTYAAGGSAAAEATDNAKVPLLLQKF